MTWTKAAAPGVVVLLAVAGCASERPQGGDDKTLKIAVVDNADLTRLEALSKSFTAANPGVKLEWETLGEGELRQKVTTDVATKGGQYDVVSLGAYETEIWSEKDLLEPMTDLPADYQVDDLLPNIRQALTTKGSLYALPVYGESSFTMYRKDLFAEAGLTMPEQPSWDFIVKAAKKLDSLDKGSGICLRGKAGWGENMALLTSMANSFGGRWFDKDWTAQLDSPAWGKAMSTYVELGKYAPDDVAGNGYNENLELFRDGKCGIWVDSTAAASTIAQSKTPAVADNAAYAPAPDAGKGKNSAWLWSWSLAVPSSSTKKELAQKFAAWATSPAYAELVAEEYGWVNAPPGTRESLYRNPKYLQAAPFAKPTKAAISAADLEDPTVDPVPYVGIQYVAIPEFQGLGTAVGNRATKSLTGDISVGEALDNAQWVTTKVMGKQDQQADK